MNTFIICIVLFMTTSIIFAVLYCKERLKVEKSEKLHKEQLTVNQNVMDSLNKEVNRLNKKIKEIKQQSMFDDIHNKERR